ncbi:MAG: hypothetical protein Fues2KO_32200 [Fuerstiella sp.]
MRLSGDIIGLFIAASVTDHGKAARLLRQHPELREASWLGDERLINFLVIKNHCDGVRFCLQNGFDANQSDGEFGDSPLHYACMLDYSEMVILLLEFGADCNAVSCINDTPLHCCVRNGNSEIADLLLSHGADPNYTTELDETIFDNWPDDSTKQAGLALILQQHNVQVPGR